MLVIAALSLALSAGPPAGPDDSHDLVLLHPARPYRLRLHLRIRGQPFTAPWTRQVARLFRHLDADGDGRVSRKEAALAPGREQWLQMSAGDPTIDPEPAADFSQLARGKSFATLADLEAFYSGTAAGPLRMGYASTSRSGDPLADRMWDSLVAPGTPWRKLSSVDVKAAPKRLARFDADEDDVVTMAELLEFPEGSIYVPTPPMASGPAHGRALHGLPFFSLRPGEPTDALEKALRAAYPRGTVTLGSPDAELMFDVGRQAVPHVVGKVAGGITVRGSRGGLMLGVRDWVLHLHVAGPPDAIGSRREDARAVFKSLDVNSNGYLDRDEVARPPFRFVSWQRLADANQDGMVTEREFLSFASMLDALNGQRVAVDLAGQRKSLFHLFDSDGDGRLSRRELANAWRLLPVGGKEWSREELPEVFRLTVSVGRANLGDEASRRRRFTPPERGPVWFRRMDRNRDGDVSRAEWLGTKEEFDRIDTDGDGLISPEEAEAHDRERRKRPR